MPPLSFLFLPIVGLDGEFSFLPLMPHTCLLFLLTLTLLDDTRFPLPPSLSHYWDDAWCLPHWMDNEWIGWQYQPLPCLFSLTEPAGWASCHCCCCQTVEWSGPMANGRPVGQYHGWITTLPMKAIGGHNSHYHYTPRHYHITGHYRGAFPLPPSPFPLPLSCRLVRVVVVGNKWHNGIWGMVTEWTYQFSLPLYPVCVREGVSGMGTDYFPSSGRGLTGHNLVGNLADWIGEAGMSLDCRWGRIEWAPAAVPHLGMDDRWIDIGHLEFPGWFGHVSPSPRPVIHCFWLPLSWNGRY